MALAFDKDMIAAMMGMKVKLQPTGDVGLFHVSLMIHSLSQLVGDTLNARREALLYNYRLHHATTGHTMIHTVADCVSYQGCCMTWIFEGRWSPRISRL